MKTLMNLYVNFIRLAKRARSLPQTIALALQQKRRKTLLDEREVERLDRLRHPSNYRGR
jgi:hypothetical protein